MTGALMASFCKSTDSRKFTSSSVKVCFAFSISADTVAVNVSCNVQDKVNVFDNMQIQRKRPMVKSRAFPLDLKLLI